MATLTTPGPYFEGMTIQEMVDETLGILGVAPGDYNRYPLASIILALNLGGVRFAKLTSCLQMPAIIILRAGQQNYHLPFGILRVLSARIHNSNTLTDYWELKIIRAALSMQLRDSQYRGTQGTPEFLFPTYKGGVVNYVGLSPIPSGDGTLVGPDPRYGKITSNVDVTILGNITGDALSVSADMVDDAGRDLATLGVVPGMQVFNLTQSKSGKITAITTTNLQNDTIVAALTGGASWAVGDSWEVLVSEYGTITDSDGLTTMLPSYLGTVGDLIPFEGNLHMDVARKPATLTVDNLLVSSEIPTHYQEALIAYAVFRLGQRMFKGVVQSDKSAKNLEQFTSLVAQYNADEDFVEESDAEITDMNWIY